MSIATFNRILLQSLTCYRPQSVGHQTRLYARARWTHRNPAKVLLPFEPSPTSLKEEKVIDLESVKVKESKQNLRLNEITSPKSTKSVAVSENSASHQTDKPKIKKPQIEKVSKPRTTPMQVKVFDDNNEIIYEKCKDNDGRISSLFVKLKSKKQREKAGQILVEGWRLIVDGLEAKCKLKVIMFSRTEDLNNLRFCLPKTGVRIYKVPYRALKLWSSVETSPGIFGIFDTPTAENINRASRPFPMQIICDNIRDPGNLGAIMRAAAGAGAERVLLTKGCVDLWEQKVVRSAAGAHFRLPVYSGIDWEKIPEYVDKNSSVLIAESNVSDAPEVENQIPVIPYYGIEYPSYKNMTLIIGGETEGISEDSYRFAESRNGLRINIPLQNGVDSLNTGAAVAVIAFEIKKQLLQAWSKQSDRQTVNAT